LLITDLGVFSTPHTCQLQAREAGVQEPRPVTACLVVRLDVAVFDQDPEQQRRAGADPSRHVQRPCRQPFARHSTLFIDGAAHRGGYDPTTLPAALGAQLP